MVHACTQHNLGGLLDEERGKMQWVGGNTNVRCNNDPTKRKKEKNAECQNAAYNPTNQADDPINFFDPARLGILSTISFIE